MNGLSLQGGGVLGYGQTLILIDAEAYWHKPSYKIFDIIAGTSVGSIIGACLSIGMPASQIQQFFIKQAPFIFQKHWYTNIKSLFNPKYTSKDIELALKLTLGTKTLKDCLGKFVATSYDWKSDRPIYFKSFEKSYSNDDFIIIGYDSDICLWEVCRASSAAQTYFPAYLYEDMVLMDGGNIGDNNPDLLILSEMLRLDNLNNIKLLSIGSGNSKWKESEEVMIKPGLLRAGIKTIEILFSAGEDSQVYKAGYLLKDNYYRLSPKLNKGIDIDDSETALRDIPKAIDNLLLVQSNVLSYFK